MSNILNFIREKSYYLLCATIILIIVFIIIGACSNNTVKTYDAIESDMVIAAKQYYEDRNGLLPKENNASVRVSISSLVESELMSEVVDPEEKSKTCNGYVEVTKLDDEYSYIPFLTCEGNYEPQYLIDKIKAEKTDELGNGVYYVDGAYVYRGKTVNNYVNFNEQLWRIINVNEDGVIKLVLAEKLQSTYNWDTQYNSEKKGNYGITTNYLYTNIRQSLNRYYDTNFTKESKAKMVKQNLCVGSYLSTDAFNKEKECSVKTAGEYVGLLNVSDYYYSSLDENCKTLKSRECGNRNYLYNSDINTWTLNPVDKTTYKVFYISSGVNSSYAKSSKKINPVIYLSSNVLINDGNGTFKNPYIIK